MNDAGASVREWGQQARRKARRGVWRRVLAWLGLSAAARRADRHAADCEAGAIGEQRTAALLATLEGEGWTVLHDRAIPGAHSANADHVLVSPGARVFLVDSKMWTGDYLMRPQDGQLMQGNQPRPRALRSIRFETELVVRALAVPVTPILAFHQAPVADDGFLLDDVVVIPAHRLVTLLRANDWRPDPFAAQLLAQAARKRLPAYKGRAGR